MLKSVDGGGRVVAGGELLGPVLEEGMLPSARSVSRAAKLGLSTRRCRPGGLCGRGVVWMHWRHRPRMTLGCRLEPPSADRVHRIVGRVLRVRMRVQIRLQIRLRIRQSWRLRL